MGAPDVVVTAAGFPVFDTTSRSRAILSFSRLAAVLLLAALVLVNIVLGRASTRVDLTEEGLFTLSDGTKKIASGLKDPARIRVFWGGLPPNEEVKRRKFSALLEELEDASNGMVSVRWIDTADKAGREEAVEAKVQEFKFIAKVGNRQQAENGFCSLVVQSGSGEPQVLDALTLIEREFEYQVASALVRASRKSAGVLALIDASGAGPEGGGRPGLFRGLQEQLQRAFGDDVQYWHTLDKPLPDNVTTMLLVAPTNLKDEQVYHLEQFLLRGGKALVLLDKHRIDTVLDRPYGEPDPTGLESWLQNLGVSVGRGVAGESDRRLWMIYPIVGQGPRGEFAGSGYWFPVRAENMDRTHPALTGLDLVPMYWPTPLSVDQEVQKAAGRVAQVLATTSEAGFRSEDLQALKAGETPLGLPREKVPLMVLLEGPVTSLWKGKPAPGEPPPAPTPPPAVEALKPPEPAAPAPAPAPEPAPAAPEAPKEPAPAPSAPPAEPKPPEPQAPDPKTPDPKAPEPPAPTPQPPAPPGPKGAPGDEGQPGPVALPGGPAVPGAPAAEPAGPKRLEEGPVRLLLLGDADLTGDVLGQENRTTMMLRLGTAGNALVLNSIDWLMGDDALLSLRGKATKPRTIAEVEDNKRTLLMWLNLGGVPLLMLFVGVIVFLRRQAQR